MVESPLFLKRVFNGNIEDGSEEGGNLLLC